MNRKSPFKFLDAFDKDDHEEFFGRDQEVEDLYELMFKTPLALIFGLSGTGKTSLIKCGLANRFNGPDWYPVFIRRGSDMNESIRKEIEPKLGDRAWTDLNQAVSYLFQDWLRPVYLIFDQFEEIFTLGNRDEQQQFAHTLRTLLNAGLQCRVLLVMREEYFGRLKDLEPILPELYNFTYRVEPMDEDRLRQVVFRSCARFNISLEEPVEDRFQEIMANLNRNNGEQIIHLPYLQIYMHLLYAEDVQQRYPNGLPDEAVMPPLTFTRQDIAHIGRIDELLTRFLDEQEKEIHAELAIKYDNPPEKFVSRLLSLFVTAETTKRPVAYELDSNNQINLILPGENPIQDLPDALISDALILLENRQLLRILPYRIELAHETLAKLIDQRQEKIKDTISRIAIAYREWEQSNRKDYLTRYQLERMGDLLPDVLPFLPGDQKYFVEKSKTQQRFRDRLKVALGILGAGIFILGLIVSQYYREQNEKEAIRIEERNRLKTNNEIFIEKVLYNFIYELRYNDAFRAMKLTQNSGNYNPYTASLLFEIAYFYTESRQLDSAKSCINFMLDLSPELQKSIQANTINAISATTVMRTVLQQMDAKRFDEAEHRYFPNMVPVEGGEFQWGCTAGNIHCPPKYQSRLRIRVDAFEMAVTEITSWQYAVYAASCRPKLDTLMNDGIIFGGNYPATHVSWYEAIHYVNWLNKRMGLDTAYTFVSETRPGVWIVRPNPNAKNSYRLPTDAEWEYAAKGGESQGPYLFSGSNIADSVAWFLTNSLVNKNPRPHPVKSKLPNKLGLFDMSGNVWEWCQDLYTNKEPETYDNPTGPTNGFKTVVRGGSYNYDETSSWVFTRGFGYPDLKKPGFGFRVVKMVSKD